jgi:hypothetical protein
MADYSPGELVKQVERQVNSVLRRTDWAAVNGAGRKAVDELRQSLSDAKIYARDYELSEMRDEQLDNFKKAKKYLGLARRQILRASEFDVFSAIDVAHLTAQIDQAGADLK